MKLEQNLEVEKLISIAKEEVKYYNQLGEIITDKAIIDNIKEIENKPIPQINRIDLSTL